MYMFVTLYFVYRTITIYYYHHRLEIVDAENLNFPMLKRKIKVSKRCTFQGFRKKLRTVVEID